MQRRNKIGNQPIPLAVFLPAQWDLYSKMSSLALTCLWETGGSVQCASVISCNDATCQPVVKCLNVVLAKSKQLQHCVFKIGQVFMA